MNMDENKNSFYYYSIENYPFPYPLMSFHDLFPMKKCIFEGEKYNIPQNYNKYLSGYGDYWQLPPDFDKIPHFDYFENSIDQINNFLRDKKRKI